MRPAGTRGKDEIAPCDAASTDAHSFDYLTLNANMRSNAKTAEIAEPGTQEDAMENS